MKSKIKYKILWFWHLIYLVYHIPGEEGAWFAIRLHCNLKDKEIEPLLNYHDNIFQIRDNEGHINEPVSGQTQPGRDSGYLT
jgi:hypothetical protein